jgi:hypothetical protein
MAIFSPDFVDPNDEIGFGWWLNAHALEHEQFTRIGLLNTPTLIFPQFDLYSWFGGNPVARSGWLNAHENMHASLRASTNIFGYDLSEVDWDSFEYRLVWMDAHAFEHAQLRKAFGLT